MAEAIGLAVLAGGVVGVGQAGHEDHARFLAEALNGHGNTRGRAAVDHDGAVFFDHRLGRCARGVRFGLGVAGHEVNLLAQDAVALECLRGEGVQAAAVAHPVQVLDRKLLSEQFVIAFVGIGAGLGHVETQGHGAAGRFVGVAGSRRGLSGENGRQCDAGTGDGTGFQHTTTREIRFGHVILPFGETCTGLLKPTHCAHLCKIIIVGERKISQQLLSKQQFFCKVIRNSIVCVVKKLFGGAESR